MTLCPCVVDERIISLAGSWYALEGVVRSDHISDFRVMLKQDGVDVVDMEVILVISGIDYYGAMLTSSVRPHEPTGKGDDLAFTHVAVRLDKVSGQWYRSEYIMDDGSVESTRLSTLKAMEFIVGA